MLQWPRSLAVSLDLVYNGSLDPLRSAVFNSCAFSKNSQNSQLMQFSLHKGRNSFSLMRFWLLMTSLLRTWLMLIFARPTKMQEPRTGLIGRLCALWPFFIPSLKKTNEYNKLSKYIQGSCLMLLLGPEGVSSTLFFTSDGNFSNFQMAILKP